ncbi:hypothetical protein UFOVP1287_12 [uncultured Caudovirales phage]|uniref:Uncharacterized protein n=1 Tax=uncultured Caudovirales phage TaxID=2100421 RepID=A0A6J5S8C1_9CAUD|nr:hypothetical protein UFOVP1287_12 [uncultured Caudovirales phage]CAB4205140.1 hypothetical protein UFOVP1408_28 [uncultured Caudovirales phage]
MSDQTTLRIGRFLLAHDPNFLQKDEYDLFSIEVEDGRERLMWVISVKADEAEQLSQLLHMVSEKLAWHIAELLGVP